MLMAKTGMPEEEWGREWARVSEDRDLWRDLIGQVVKDREEKADEDLWENRHTEEADAARGARLEEAQQQIALMMEQVARWRSAPGVSGS